MDQSKAALDLQSQQMDTLKQQLAVMDALKHRVASLEAEVATLRAEANAGPDAHHGIHSTPLHPHALTYFLRRWL